MQGYGAGKSRHRVGLDGHVLHCGAVVGKVIFPGVVCTPAMVLYIAICATPTPGGLRRQPGGLRRQAGVLRRKAAEVRPDGLLMRGLCS